MTTAVFAYFSPKALQPADGRWLSRLLMEMACLEQAHHIIIYTNEPGNIAVAHPMIAQPIQKAPTVNFFTRYRYLRQWKKQAMDAGAEKLLVCGWQSFVETSLPFVVFVPPQGVASAQTKFPQKLITQSGGFLVTSERQKQHLEKAGARQGVQLPGGPLSAAAPTMDPEQVRAKYTEDCAYFIYAGPISDTPSLVVLLKAFSRFKRRQKSSFKMVLLPAAEVGLTALQQVLSNYKYRSEVVLPAAPLPESEVAALLTAAYTFVQPGAPALYGTGLLEAISAGLPVIAKNGAMATEILADAAVFYPEGDDELLAGHLMALYKDETHRGRMAAAAKLRAAHFSWKHTAEKVQQAIAGAVK
jgi:glycosyltransferase involved in cell wall biosynthesis